MPNNGYFHNGGYGPHTKFLGIPPSAQPLVPAQPSSSSSSSAAAGEPAFSMELLADLDAAVRALWQSYFPPIDRNAAIAANGQQPNQPVPLHQRDYSSSDPYVRWCVRVACAFRLDVSQLGKGAGATGTTAEGTSRYFCLADVTKHRRVYFDFAQLLAEVAPLFVRHVAEPLQAESEERGEPGEFTVPAGKTGPAAVQFVFSRALATRPQFMLALLALAAHAAMRAHVERLDRDDSGLAGVADSAEPLPTTLAPRLRGFPSVFSDLSRITAPLEDRLVSVRGVIAATGDVRPLVRAMAFECVVCRERTSTRFPDGAYNPPLMCKKPSINGPGKCNSKNFRPLIDAVVTGDWQGIKLQATSASLAKRREEEQAREDRERGDGAGPVFGGAGGSGGGGGNGQQGKPLPQELVWLEVELYDDLAALHNGGEEVVVTGIVRGRRHDRNTNMSLFDTYIDAVDIVPAGAYVPHALQRALANAVEKQYNPFAELAALSLDGKSTGGAAKPASLEVVVQGRLFDHAAAAIAAALPSDVAGVHSTAGDDLSPLAARQRGAAVGTEPPDPLLVLEAAVFAHARELADAQRQQHQHSVDYGTQGPAAAIAKHGGASDVTVVACGELLSAGDLATLHRVRTNTQPSGSAVVSQSNMLRLLAHSLCPGIYGQDHVKAALVLALLAGVVKHPGEDSDSALRGSIHVLVVGDPGLGKSRLLSAVAAAAPRSSYVTAKGTTVAGLGASAMREKNAGVGTGVVQRGALPLADRGVCCVDELDKMAEADRAVLLECMEQQVVTLAKAGVSARLEARTGVVAAANPVRGHYDRSLSLRDNVKISAALLTRFDLTFLLEDRVDAARDLLMSHHVIEMHAGRNSLSAPRLRQAGSGQMARVREWEPSDPDGAFPPHLHQQHYNNEHNQRHQHQRPAQSFDTAFENWQQHERPSLAALLRLPDGDEPLSLLPMQLLRRYIAYARAHCHPTLTEAARRVVLAYWTRLRSDHRKAERDGGGGPPVSVRQLESVVRLTEAVAKAELRQVATASDALVATELMRVAMSSMTSGADPNAMGAGDDAGGFTPLAAQDAGSGYGTVPANVPTARKGGKLSKPKVAQYIQDELARRLRSDPSHSRIFTRREIVELCDRAKIDATLAEGAIEGLHQVGVLLAHGGSAFKFSP